ncbi:Polypyrimidine tract-binding protein-like protein 2 [Heracleum sosnowskyi]|uniref:Polypyrimidine tract-binding protein-like protein 2 n=1 Tax=Heracleum sosnowskyi TaxID=360622 RepID=A0AAD8M6L8_9APIA|nr:Polypyrimidine tract-binding protein-like protein 2 [Heracleum sosnowskyi]
MVKLATARDSRMYGPRQSRKRSEYMNAGLYVFATILLVVGFATQLSLKEQKIGVVFVLIGLFIIAIVNIHDLIAHLAGIDYCLALMEYDMQLALVEFAVPLLQSLGTLLSFLAILFLFIQEEKQKYYKLEKHGMNMLIAGSSLWVLGSIHNSCQIYERADGHVQVLQESVHIPFLMGSLLFLVGSVINGREQASTLHHGLDLFSETWTWLCMVGSLMLFIGGITNVVKVFKMQQFDNGLRLEKLRGGAQERLAHVREGQVPLIRENQRRRQAEQVGPSVTPTPYKDVLLGQP